MRFQKIAVFFFLSPLSPTSGCRPHTTISTYVFLFCPEFSDHSPNIIDTTLLRSTNGCVCFAWMLNQCVCRSHLVTVDVFGPFLFVTEFITQGNTEHSMFYEPMCESWAIYAVILFPYRMLSMLQHQRHKLCALDWLEHLYFWWYLSGSVPCKWYPSCNFSILIMFTQLDNMAQVYVYSNLYIKLNHIISFWEFHFHTRILCSLFKLLQHVFQLIWVFDSNNPDLKWLRKAQLSNLSNANWVSWRNLPTPM